MESKVTSDLQPAQKTHPPSPVAQWPTLHVSLNPCPSQQPPQQPTRPGAPSSSYLQSSLPNETTTPPRLRRSPRKHPTPSPDNQPIKNNNIMANVQDSSSINTFDHNDDQHVAPSAGSPSNPYEIFAPCEFDDTDHVARFYTYIKQVKVVNLRRICKDWGLRQNRNKEELLAGLMLHIYIKNNEGNTLHELIAMNGALHSFSSWEEVAIQNFTTWELLPEIQILVQRVVEKDRVQIVRKLKKILGVNGGDSGASTRANFCLNEFARLVVLLRDDERCKFLLRATGDELTRRQLDSNFTRESFWGGIAVRFNDPAVDSRENFTGYLDEVDSNERPLCERSAAALKNAFYSAKKLFTEVYKKWSASGQNDPQRILHFLTNTGNNDLSMESKKTLILFIVCKIGTPEENVDLLQATSKLINSTHGGCDVGVGSLADGEEPVEKPTSKKRNSGDMLQQNMERVHKKMDKVYDMFEETLSMQKSATTQKQSNSRVSKAKEANELFDEVLASADRCKRAMAFEDEEMRKMARVTWLENKKLYREHAKEVYGVNFDSQEKN